MYTVQQIKSALSRVVVARLHRHSPPSSGRSGGAKNSGGLKGPEGVTGIRVEGRVLLGGESSQKL